MGYPIRGSYYMRTGKKMTREVTVYNAWQKWILLEASDGAVDFKVVKKTPKSITFELKSAYAVNIKSTLNTFFQELKEDKNSNYQESKEFNKNPVKSEFEYMIKK